MKDLCAAMGIEDGYCRCGCGNKTSIVQHDDPVSGRRRGERNKYIKGHNRREKRKEENGRWNGGRFVTDQGYVLILEPEHPRATKYRYVPEQILVAEKVLGKYLPRQAVVHHINGIRDDNRPENLVVCESMGYHSFLHQREIAYRACGHSDWKKCLVCKEYDSMEKLRCFPKHHNWHHVSCYNASRRVDNTSRSDPARFIALANEWCREHPEKGE